MARVLKIARMGHPILTQRAMQVKDPTHGEIQCVLADMQATLDDIGSFAGLAAPQVHISLRIIFYALSQKRADPEYDPQGVPLTILINPEITPLVEKKELGWEACFSLPGLMGEVPRYQSIHVKALTPKGKPFEYEAHGMHARVIQHEVDHLDGILYPQRMVDLSRFGYREEILKHVCQ